MKNAQRPDHVSLTTLLGWLREGRFVIPDFQREFEWDPSDIKELMRSIFLDYYIGSLLIWKGKKETFETLACEKIYGFQAENAHPEYIVLDGQQRLTAMYYAFMAPKISAPRRKNRFLYFIRVDHFVEDNPDDAFVYDWTRRGEQLLENQEQQFETHMFPLAVIGKGGWDLPNWMQGYEQYWKSRLETAQETDPGEAASAERNVQNAAKFGEIIRGIVEEYQISYIELDRDLEIEKVCDIFTQINSRGIRLDVFDLINALLKPKGIQLKLMWREAEERLAFVESERMNVYALQVMSILKQNYCSPKYLYYLLPGQEKKVRRPDGGIEKEILVSDTGEFKRLWGDSIKLLEDAISVLSHPQEYGAISSKYLPYVSILPAFAAIRHAAQQLPAEHRLSAQRKIRQWYWASVFMNRYSGAVESLSARDYQDLREWFEDDDARPGVVDQFIRNFRSLDLVKETKHGTAIYNGIFNLLIINGARDWITGDITQSNLDDHHIVPQSWGKELGGDIPIDSILNRTPLSAETNQNVIRKRLPNEYLPELIEKNGESHVRATLESHFISSKAFDILMRQPFGPDDYQKFIRERQNTILRAIEDLLIKERLDLPPNLRVLDNRIEKVELAIRSIINEKLTDFSEIPGHLHTKIQDREDRVKIRNPALDGSSESGLAQRLQYTDFRELQDIILNKNLWLRFEPILRNKSETERRFSQVAELRNSIRHSRSVDEVTRKDGEAGLAWFEQALRVE